MILKTLSKTLNITQQDHKKKKTNNNNNNNRDKNRIKTKPFLMAC